MSIFKKSLLWFRRDLRITDHTALYHALKQSMQVYCVFIYDREILDPLLASGVHADRRVDFIIASVEELDKALRALGSALIVRHDLATHAIPTLTRQLNIEAVFCNHDYEPAAILRDANIEQQLIQDNRHWFTFKDQVIFEKKEIVTQAKTSFSVFTAYKKAWITQVTKTNNKFCIQQYSIKHYLKNLAPPLQTEVYIPLKLMLKRLGFKLSNLHILPIPTGISGAQKSLHDFLPRLALYPATRNFPAIKGPSYLSIHLRFGTISIRTLVNLALKIIHIGQKDSLGASVWLSQLIWRDFYFMILYHHPSVINHAFKANYDNIIWENGVQAEINFHAWCEGSTGYPFIDAAMLQLNQTGYMHNRLRMIVASFLIKDLGLDWRRGEHYFATKLNDFDLAANNGSWQWVSSTGCDAQPYLRIFNPIIQSKKFDPDGKFIRHYLPQLSKLSNQCIHAPWFCSSIELAAAGIKLGLNYPRPLVDHMIARKKTLLRYSKIIKI